MLFSIGFYFFAAFFSCAYPNRNRFGLAFDRRNGSFAPVSAARKNFSSLSFAFRRIFLLFPAQNSLFTDRNLPFGGTGNKQCGWPFVSDLSFSLFSWGNSDPFGLPFGCFLPENEG